MPLRKHLLLVLVLAPSASILASDRLVQLFCGEEFRQFIRDLDIVQIRHREMRVPEDADVGQMGQVGVAAIGVDQIDELLRHLPIVYHVRIDTTGGRVLQRSRAAAVAPGESVEREVF